jgi:hypothetical protein
MINNYGSSSFNKLDSDIKKDGSDESLQKDFVYDFEDEKDAIVEEVLPVKETPIVEEISSKSDSVYVYASRDIQKPGTAKVYKGVNEISKKDFERWGTNNVVRLATKQEIKDYKK